MNWFYFNKEKYVSCEILTYAKIFEFVPSCKDLLLQNAQEELKFQQNNDRFNFYILFLTEVFHPFRKVPDKDYQWIFNSENNQVENMLFFHAFFQHYVLTKNQQAANNMIDSITDEYFMVCLSSDFKHIEYFIHYCCVRIQLEKTNEIPYITNFLRHDWKKLFIKNVGKWNEMLLKKITNFKKNVVSDDDIMCAISYCELMFIMKTQFFWLIEANIGSSEILKQNIVEYCKQIQLKVECTNKYYNLFQITMHINELDVCVPNYSIVILTLRNWLNTIQPNQFSIVGKNKNEFEETMPLAFFLKHYTNNIGKVVCEFYKIETKKETFSANVNMLFT